MRASVASMRLRVWPGVAGSRAEGRRVRRVLRRARRQGGNGRDHLRFGGRLRSCAWRFSSGVHSWRLAAASWPDLDLPEEPKPI